MKELGQLQRQFHDSLSSEQEDKLRMSQAHSERLNKLQFEHNKELEVVKQNTKRDEASIRKELDEVTKEKNQTKIESAKAT